MSTLFQIRIIQFQAAGYDYYWECIVNDLYLSKRGVTCAANMAVRCEMSLDAILASRILNRDRLDKPCSPECLKKMALKLTRWKILSPSLGLTSEEEHKILKSHQKNSQRRVGMLNLWQEKFGDQATYLKLATGFEGAKMTDMIISLLDWLKEAESPSTGRRVTRVPKLGTLYERLITHGSVVIYTNLLSLAVSV